MIEKIKSDLRVGKITKRILASKECPSLQSTTPKMAKIHCSERNGTLNHRSTFVVQVSSGELGNEVAGQK